MTDRDQVQYVTEAPAVLTASSSFPIVATTTVEAGEVFQQSAVFSDIGGDVSLMLPTLDKQVQRVARLLAMRVLGAASPAEEGGRNEIDIASHLLDYLDGEGNRDGKHLQQVVHALLHDTSLFGGKSDEQVDSSYARALIRRFILQVTSNQKKRLEVHAVDCARAAHKEEDEASPEFDTGHLSAKRLLACLRRALKPPRAASMDSNVLNNVYRTHLVDRLIAWLSPTLRLADDPEMHSADLDVYSDVWAYRHCGGLLAESIELPRGPSDEATFDALGLGMVLNLNETTAPAFDACVSLPAILHQAKQYPDMPAAQLIMPAQQAQARDAFRDRLTASAERAWQATAEGRYETARLAFRTRTELARDTIAQLCEVRTETKENDRLVQMYKTIGVGYKCFESTPPLPELDARFKAGVKELGQRFAELEVEIWDYAVQGLSDVNRNWLKRARVSVFKATLHPAIPKTLFPGGGYYRPPPALEARDHIEFLSARYAVSAERVFVIDRETHPLILKPVKMNAEGLWPYLKPSSHRLVGDEHVVRHDETLLKEVDETLTDLGVRLAGHRREKLEAALDALGFEPTGFEEMTTLLAGLIPFRTCAAGKHVGNGQRLFACVADLLLIWPVVGPTGRLVAAGSRAIGRRARFGIAALSPRAALRYDLMAAAQRALRRTGSHPPMTAGYQRLRAFESAIAGIDTSAAREFVLETAGLSVLEGDLQTVGALFAEVDPRTMATEWLAAPGRQSAERQFVQSMATQASTGQDVGWLLLPVSDVADEVRYAAVNPVTGRSFGPRWLCSAPATCVTEESALGVRTLAKLCRAKAHRRSIANPDGVDRVADHPANKARIDHPGGNAGSSGASTDACELAAQIASLGFDHGPSEIAPLEVVFGASLATGETVRAGVPSLIRLAAAALFPVEHFPTLAALSRAPSTMDHIAHPILIARLREIALLDRLDVATRTMLLDVARRRVLPVATEVGLLERVETPALAIWQTFELCLDRLHGQSVLIATAAGEQPFRGLPVFPAWTVDQHNRVVLITQRGRLAFDSVTGGAVSIAPLRHLEVRLANGNIERRLVDAADFCVAPPTNAEPPFVPFSSDMSRQPRDVVVRVQSNFMRRSPLRPLSYLEDDVLRSVTTSPRNARLALADMVPVEEGAVLGMIEVFDIERIGTTTVAPVARVTRPYSIDSAMTSDAGVLAITRSDDREIIEFWTPGEIWAINDRYIHQPLGWVQGESFFYTSALPTGMPKVVLYQILGRRKITLPFDQRRMAAQGGVRRHPTVRAFALSSMQAVAAVMYNDDLVLLYDVARAVEADGSLVANVIRATHIAEAAHAPRSSLTLRFGSSFDELYLVMVEMKGGALPRVRQIRVNFVAHPPGNPPVQ